VDADLLPIYLWSHTQPVERDPADLLEIVGGDMDVAHTALPLPGPINRQAGHATAQDFVTIHGMHDLFRAIHPVNRQDAGHLLAIPGEREMQIGRERTGPKGDFDALNLVWGTGDELLVALHLALIEEDILFGVLEEGPL